MFQTCCFCCCWCLQIVINALKAGNERGTQSSRRKYQRLRGSIIRCDFDLSSDKDKGQTEINSKHVEMSFSATAEIIIRRHQRILLL